jgi:N-acetylglutamate synthase-like GNAT family acetyltransferase
MKAEIRRADLSDAAKLASLIARSFQDVADRFGLSPTNAPTHPSNAAPQWIHDDVASGVEYLIAEIDGEAIACVGYRRTSAEILEAQRLAVLPEHRGSGVANQLNQAVLQTARDLGVARIRIAVVSGHHSLRHWYVRMGFVETEERRFTHLPFAVQYLELALEEGDKSADA